MVTASRPLLSKPRYYCSHWSDSKNYAAAPFVLPRGTPLTPGARLCRLCPILPHIFGARTKQKTDCYAREIILFFDPIPARSNRNIGVRESIQCTRTIREIRVCIYA